MTAPAVPEQVLAQLEANLRAAGIAYTPADIDGMAAKGFLSRVVALDTLVAAAPSDIVPDMLRDSADDRCVPGVSMATPGPGSPAGDGEIGRLAAEIRAGRVTPQALTEQALAQIAANDRQINAFQLVLAEQARAAAQQAAQELAQGIDRGPLHGIPVAVKDLFNLAGTVTTAGSQILAEHMAQHDSAAVERLRAAGAIIVGKTRMSEFAYSPGSNNGHYGSTRNPHNHAHDAGGSSSGSAAAVAAGWVPAALGTDTGGSVRIPAALCGIVGLKPTFGRISLYGAVTLAWSLDHLGPLTRTVADAAVLLDLLAGYDPRDPRTRRVPPPNSLVTLARGVAGLRVGVVRDDGSHTALGSVAQMAAWQHGLAALERAGATLVELAMPELEELRAVQGCILALEAASFHEPWLRTRLHDYGEFMRQRILASYAYGSRAYVQAQQLRNSLRRRCISLFERIDLLSTPSQPDAAPLLGVPGSTLFTNPFNTLGWPAVSVPVGTDPNNLPLGMQIIAPPWEEALVLRAARVVERG